MTQLSKIETDQPQEIASRAPDPIVQMIERVVMNPNADLDKLERMLAMKERMDAQNAKIAFARALSAARATMPPILKDATVDFTTQKGRTHYRHETLAGIARVIDPILANHGLSYRFRTDQGNGGVKVTCVIQHADGHSEETSLSGSPDGSGSKNSFQAVGSAVTYLQRYTLKAALGLSAEVDDDGQSAAPRGGGQREEGGNNPPRQEDRGFDPQAAADKIIGKLRKADTIDVLTATWRNWGEIIADVKDASRADFDRLNDEKERLKRELTPKPNADLGGDEIPY